MTGATGFVGRWMIEALNATGHEVVAAPGHRELDIADANAVTGLLKSEQPDGVVHLAAIAYAADAAADSAEAVRINLGGTLAVLEACLALARPPVVLVAGSSEVYAAPENHHALTEVSPLGPRNIYALTKLGAEALAVHASARGLRVAVARSFNHTGPGQRPVFAVPAFANRIVAARAEGRHSIAVGNVDVWRDIGDVRDTVRAYVRALEAMAEAPVPFVPPVFNVATGQPTELRGLIQHLSNTLGWEVALRHDSALIRHDDPPWIAGDFTRLRDWLSWEPRIPLKVTIADLVAAL